jgi:ribosomal protein S18 acetylase RimI-like enzyme
MDNWTLRAADVADAEFLYRVYASTRYEDLAPTGWSAEQTEAFVRSQFGLQDRHYRLHYPVARFDIVQVCGEPVGRLYVDRGRKDVRVLDIALLPEFRHHGLGRSLLEAVLAEAGTRGQSVCLHVERTNPALGLYRRLGFEIVDDRESVYLETHWHPRCANAAVKATEAINLSP